MDESRFDALTRSLVTTRSRRGFIGGLLGLGAGLAGLASAGAACPPDQVDRRGVCVCKTTRRPPVGGVCPCRGRATRCGDACVDTSRDAANCGACGVACTANQQCRGGACAGVECRVDGDCGASDACVAFACESGVCVRTATVCDGGDPCASSVCDPAVGCVHTPVVCSVPTPFCDPATGGCVACLHDHHCPPEGVCVGGACCVPDTALVCQGRECGTAINRCGQVVTCGPGCLECQVCSEGGFCFGMPAEDHVACGQDGVCCGGSCWPCRTGTPCDPVLGGCGFNCATCCNGYVLDPENGFVCT